MTDIAPPQHHLRTLGMSRAAAAGIKSAKDTVEWFCADRIDALEAEIEKLREEVGSSVPFQDRVVQWRDACFADDTTEPHERGDRFLEEVLELLQSIGYPRKRIQALVGYVYGRPVGDPAQEVGGTMLTLAMLCHEKGIRLNEAGEAELARVWTKIDKIREKQATKPRGPLPDTPRELTDD